MPWKNFTSPTSRSHFRPNDLPSPLEYFAGEGIKLIGRGEWRTARCTFHSPDKHPSMRINVRDGRFKCMACGASGQDVLAFHRRRYGMHFIDACRDLGAWTEAR